MQYYLKDGEEHQRVIFKEEDVRKYCYLLNKDFNYQVPTLMCAKLWSEFKSYKKFVKKPLILKETYVKEFNKLVTDEVYDATLSKISVKNIKDFIKHTYSLKINKNNHKCIYIEQVFIEVKR